MAFLVLGLNAPKAATLAGGHQVPAHECQVAAVAPEGTAFVSPLTVVVRAGDLLTLHRALRRIAGLVFFLIFWVLAGACQRNGVGGFLS